MTPEQLSDRAKQLLGESGVERVTEFSRYPAGWDFGRGEALQPESIATLDWFLSRHGDVIEGRLSVFFSAEGVLDLMWDSTLWGAVNLALYANGVGYHFDGCGSEEDVFVAFDDIDTLLHVLQPEKHSSMRPTP